jgi:uncharacterized membrane protein
MSDWQRKFGAMCLLVLPPYILACGGGAGRDGEGEVSQRTADLPSNPALTELVGDYLGQTPPGEVPEVFAPGVVTTGMYTRDVAMTPDGSELYFGVLLGRFSAIMETKRGEDGRWTQPEVAPFSRDSRFFYLEPAIAPDGSRFMFLSNRVEGREPTSEETGAWVNQDIWVMDREGEGWSEPYNLGPPVNSPAAEYFPSLTRDGTLYFTRGSTDGSESHIYRSRLVGGTYLGPERLGPEVNSTPIQFNAFISPDETYLIVCTGGREDSLGGTDYYVVFRNPDDTWTGPINMGDRVNTPGDGEFSPYVSLDGKYFFFMSARMRPEETIPDLLTSDFLREFREGPESGNPGIYWVKADFIEALRPER